MRYKIALCDDDRSHLSYSETLLKKTLKELECTGEIAAFASPLLLLRSAESGEFVPNIAVLDIEMKDMDGITLAGRLNELLPGCCIIFLTGYTDYVGDAYSTEHVFYVLKDRSEEYLPRAVQKAFRLLEQRDRVYLTVRHRGSTVTLNPEDVVYVESSLRKLTVCTRESSYEVTGRLDDFSGETPLPEFVRCHQSFLVNLRYVTGLQGGRFILANGTQIPISRSRLNEAKARFFDYVSPLREG